MDPLCGELLNRARYYIESMNSLFNLLELLGSCDLADAFCYPKNLSVHHSSLTIFGTIE